MVYCSKCGTQNPDTATVCSNCGAPLYTVGQQYSGSDREHYRRVENECFGLPHGGLIVGLIFGLIIVLIGFGLFLQASGIIVNFGNYIWPLILIIFGILIIIAAIYSMQRHAKQQSRSY